MSATLHAPELSALTRKIDRVLSQGVSDRCLRLIAGDLVRSTKRRIMSEKREPDGTPWVAWSDAYERSKRPGTMLKQSGALHRSIQSIVGSDSIEIGSDNIKAAVHQFGHTVRSGAFAGSYIPARRYLGFSDADERAIHDRMIEDVRKRFAA